VICPPESFVATFGAATCEPCFSNDPAATGSTTCDDPTPVPAANQDGVDGSQADQMTKANPVKKEKKEKKTKAKKDKQQHDEL